MKAKKLKEENELRAAALEEALAVKAANLKAVQDAIAERKEAAAKLKQQIEDAKNAKLEKCRLETEVWLNGGDWLIS